MPRYKVEFVYDTNRLPATNGANLMRLSQHVLGWKVRLCPRWKGIDPSSVKVTEVID